MAKILTKHFLISFGLICLASNTSGYTEKESEAVEKLRTAVKDKLSHEFMKTEEYLLRWLTAKRMDAKQAQEMLEASLKWRDENNIDEIMTEDFSTFTKQYPVHRYGVDKEGRPIYGFHFGNWVVRKAGQNGQINQLVRYLIKTILEAPRIVAEELTKTNANLNDTRHTLLIDLSGYNLREHACLQCFGLYTQFITLYENNYPEAFYKVLIVNGPTIFETIMELVRPIMSPASKRDFSVLGVRKADWVPIVQKYIDVDQIPPQYGGNKKFTG